ncbi:uncharacterized protein LOC121770556 isoform X2 [Salvia splendens]|uniref:uncharacterized protein LOC121770556 isoform X2 n=1 Tax=Salvia splendens TaxID=180675 RepID=UPI001C25F645|nr:uncharacterized protein LOC121770556 isoform X2 [Salvia splendens]
MGQSTNLQKSKGTKRPAAHYSDIESDAATLKSQKIQNELMDAMHNVRETTSAFFRLLKDLPPGLRRLKSTKIICYATMKLLGLSQAQPKNGKEVDLVSMLRQALKDEKFDCPEWIEAMECIVETIERKSEFIRNFHMPKDEVPEPEGGRVGDDDVVATNAIEAEQDVPEADNHEFSSIQ